MPDRLCFGHPSFLAHSRRRHKAALLGNGDGTDFIDILTGTCDFRDTHLLCVSTGPGHVLSEYLVLLLGPPW